MGYKTLLIYNPTAGPWDMTRSLQRLAAHLEKAGWRVDLVQTQQPGDATQLSRQGVAAAVDLVLVAGGDGTINEAANGLVGSSSALGIVPVGTGNILAHQLRMPILSVVAPLYVKDVGDALLKSRIQRVDAGVVNERFFVAWAGLGLDAEIAAQMEPRPRYAKRLRTIPYVIAAFSIASAFRGVRSTVRVEGRTFRTRTLMAVASNIQLYASFFNIAPSPRMDDGLLDIFIFKGLGFSYTLRHLVQFYGARHLHDPKVVHALARNVQVDTVPEVAIHLDGDPFGSTPARISLQPAALRLVVPASAPASLFSKAPEVVF